VFLKKSFTLDVYYLQKAKFLEIRTTNKSIDLRTEILKHTYLYKTNKKAKKASAKSVK